MNIYIYIYIYKVLGFRFIVVLISLYIYICTTNGKTTYIYRCQRLHSKEETSPVQSFMFVHLGSNTY